MNVTKLLDSLVFKEHGPHAEPVSVSEGGRILRFTLRAGQALREHKAPHSDVHLVVLQGFGSFSGEGGQEETLGPGEMAAFSAGQSHAVQALDEDLVFLAILLDSGGKP